MGIDCDQLSRELLRHWRGRRSQAALSRRLGYRSNPVFDWESGRRTPTAAKALRVATQVGVDVRKALERFYRRPLDWLAGLDPSSPTAVMQLVGELRGNDALVDLARRVGCSRYALGRWLKGQAEPDFADLLRLVDASTLRLLDFIAVLADPAQLPSVCEAWARLTRARELAYDVPWSHAVLRALELDEYRRLGRHRPGFLARQLGITDAEEARCLEMLAQTGQISWRGRRWRIDESSVVDTRSDAQRSRELRAFWSDVAAARLRAGKPGDFAFNLFGVSATDLERVRALQRDYFAELRRIIAESEPVEQVVVLNMQLVPLQP